MKKKMIIGLLLLILLVSMQLYPRRLVSQEPEELLVFGASSLTDVLQEMASAYMEENPGVVIHLNLASSGSLQVQIEQGAPADLFLSAGMKQMQALLTKELIKEETIQVFAQNRLVIVRRAGLDITVSQLTDLLDPAITQICIADPATAPVGHYSAEALQESGLWEGLQDKLIYARNVRQVLQYVELGEVDLGFVYITDAVVANEAVQLYQVPDELHQQINYPLGIIADTGKEELAQDFVAWILSPQGKEILTNYAFQINK